MMSYNQGDRVKWKWGQGWAYGKIKNSFAEKTTRKIKGTEVTRHGSEDDKAIYIEQEDGDHVLKLEMRGTAKA
ncbi:MAG: HVA1 family protein [Bacteroidia bacterium]|nr:HVA1 family protein [Bacteroidia bacterium]